MREPLFEFRSAGRTRVHDPRDVGRTAAGLLLFDFKWIARWRPEAECRGCASLFRETTIRHRLDAHFIKHTYACTRIYIYIYFFFLISYIILRHLIIVEKSSAHRTAAHKSRMPFRGWISLQIRAILQRVRRDFSASASATCDFTISRCASGEGGGAVERSSSRSLLTFDTTRFHAPITCRGAGAYFRVACPETLSQVSQTRRESWPNSFRIAKRRSAAARRA
jgi:hypothetical protein